MIKDIKKCNYNRKKNSIKNMDETQNITRVQEEFKELILCLAGLLAI